MWPRANDFFIFPTVDVTPITMRDTTPSPESNASAPAESGAYRTRSGRVVRQAVRYEPDPDTVFLDDDDYESDDGMEDDDDDEGFTVDAESDDDSVCESEIEESDSDSEMDEDEFMSDSDSVLSGNESVEDDDDDDVIDWDTLTDQASERDLVDTDEDDLGNDLEELSDEEYEEGSSWE